MSVINLDSLRDRVLERANMANSGGVGSGFIALPELDSIINGEAGELYDTVVGAYADQFTTSLLFTLAAGANAYAVTSAVYQLRGVDRQEASDWFPLRKSDWNGRGRSGSLALYSRWARDVEYRFVGQNILFTPTDAAAGSYRLWYVPGYVDLVAASDVLDYPSQWAECVIAGSAAKCLAKEESDPSVQLGLKSSLTQRIMGMAANRDAGAPDRIERVRNQAWDDF